MEATSRKPGTVEIPEGTVSVLVVCPNYWGRGTTLDAAKAEAKRQGGRLTHGYLVYTFDTDTEPWVDGGGWVRYEEGSMTSKQIVHGTQTIR